jgi:hypothetical protein
MKGPPRERHPSKTPESTKNADPQFGKDILRGTEGDVGSMLPHKSEWSVTVWVSAVEHALPKLPRDSSMDSGFGMRGKLGWAVRRSHVARARRSRRAGRMKGVSTRRWCLQGPHPISQEAGPSEPGWARAPAAAVERQRPHQWTAVMKSRTVGAGRGGAGDDGVDEGRIKKHRGFAPCSVAAPASVRVGFCSARA